MFAADGRELWIWEKTAIQRDADGRPLAVNGVMLDVTELRQTQEALLREADRRVQRARALRDGAAAPGRRASAPRAARRADRAARTAAASTSCSRSRTDDAEPGDDFSLLLVDLNRFKEVNDVLGHQSGDELLCKVAERFAREVRDEDLLARLGGDEFAVLVGARGRSEAGLEIARRLSRALEREFVLSGVPVHVEASIGIARYPLDGRDATALLRCADSAMYAAKDLSTELELFDDERDHHSPTRLKRLGELRQALHRDELVLHYQPKLQLGTGEIIGAEALVRWQHPEHGLLPPGEFVPLAEQTGLIKPLTSFVLRTALAQTRAWHEAGHDLSIAVNVSERSLLDPNFIIEVDALLADSGVPPHMLEIEITEGTIMADPARAAVVLRGLDALGVTLSLDDFGTGYSSLGRLAICRSARSRSTARSPPGSTPTSVTSRFCAPPSSSDTTSAVRSSPRARDGGGGQPRHVARLRHGAGLPHRPAARGGRADGLARRPFAKRRERTGTRGGEACATRRLVAAAGGTVEDPAHDRRTPESPERSPARGTNGRRPARGEGRAGGGLSGLRRRGRLDG